MKAMEDGKLRPQGLPDVEEAAFDVIGTRLVSFAPSAELDLIEGVLNQTFIMKRFKRGDPNGRYPGNNYLGSVQGINIEIQTRGALDHAFLNIEHKLRYKPKPGYELNESQKVMLEKFRGDVDKAKASLATLVTSFRESHPVAVSAGNAPAAQVKVQPVVQQQGAKPLLPLAQSFREESLGGASSSESASAFVSAGADSWVSHFGSAEEEIFEAVSDHFQAQHEAERAFAVEKAASRGSNLLRANKD